MKKTILHTKVITNDQGSAMVIALLTLVVVTLIGLSTINNSTTEMQITTNDLLYKRAFATADGGAEVAIKLIEKNIACSEGFYGGIGGSLYFTSGETGDRVIKVDSANDDAYLAIEDSDFAIDGENKSSPSNSQRDIYFVESPPLDDSDGVPHTNIAVEEVSKFIPGNSMLMAEGYSGIGKGGANRGVQIKFNVHSKHEFKARNSCAQIIVEYRHIVGQEEDECEFVSSGTVE